MADPSDSEMSVDLNDSYYSATDDSNEEKPMNAFDKLMKNINSEFDNDSDDSSSKTGQEGDVLLTNEVGLNKSEASKSNDSTDETDNSMFTIDSKGDTIENNIQNSKNMQIEPTSDFQIDKTRGSSLSKSLDNKQSVDDEESSDDEYTPISKPVKVRPKAKHAPVFGEADMLSSVLTDELASEDIYTYCNEDERNHEQRKATRRLLANMTKSKNTDIMKSCVLTPDVEQKHTLPAYQEGKRATKKKRQQERSQTKGKKWFDMAAPEMTEEQKNELTLIQMRHVLNPKAFYKHNDLKVLPKFFQMGKVVEHAADFYNSRVPKKQRKQTLVDELLADAEFRKYNKRKYAEVIENKSKYRGTAKIAKKIKKRRR